MHISEIFNTYNFDGCKVKEIVGGLQIYSGNIYIPPASFE